jgi:NodT family efflux transporter outer membrane factor (OMF) lipoprotein
MVCKVTARILTLLMPALVVACSMGPDYVRPRVRIPETYKEQQEWKIPEPRDHVAKGRWWEVFSDPLLNELEEQVNISNQNIFSAEAQFRQATALVQVARAAYFPTATVGSSFTRSLSSSNLTAIPTATIPISVFSIPANASWELDLWGRVRRSVENSRATADAFRFDLESIRLSAQSALAEDYFQLRALDAQKHLLDETAVALQRSLTLTENRYGSGIAARSDILQADSLLKTTQAQAIDVGVQRSQLEHAIAVLMGKAPAELSIPVKPLDAAPPEIPARVPSELLERRPDIAAAERRMAAANAQIGVVVASYYPVVTLGGNFGLESTDLSKWLTWGSRFWSFGPSVLETLFTGGARKGQTDQAYAAYETAAANYRQTVLTGFQEVEDGISTLRILEREASAQDEAVKAAQQSLSIALNQYKAGIVSYLNVITAQTAVLANQRTALVILGGRMTSAVALIRALGGDWHVPALALQRP